MRIRGEIPRKGPCGKAEGQYSILLAAETKSELKLLFRRIEIKLEARDTQTLSDYSFC
jgi:hypothetical protein